MLRNMLYLVPLMLLVGAGCAIGNKEERVDMVTNAEVEMSPGAAMEKGSEVGIIVSGKNTEGLVIEKIDPNAEEAEMPVVVDLKSGNFFFDPPLIGVKAGQEIEVHVKENRGLHTFVIDEIGLKQQLTDGATFRFTAPGTPGDYVYYCDTGEHRKLGMEGILRVEE